MANRRMFSKDVTNSDEFLDMPLSSQALYFHLGLNADDDGFVSPRGIMRLVEAKEDDLKVLGAKGFIIKFEKSVIVITHWKTNNEIKKDRYKKTIYQEHLDILGLNNGKYTLEPKCFQNVSKMDTQDRLGKDSIDKNRIEEISICEGTSLEEKKLNKIIPTIIEKFKKINPSLQYGNKTQRSACENLINHYGEEKTLKLVDAVIRSQFEDKYCPKATTPYILWQKIGDFSVYFNNKNFNNKKLENICIN